MRCLHCGKELALFKRLTSGGEFCSDAHRQKYQEEYNQLALTRLLQASPVVESAEKSTSGKTREAGVPAVDLGKEAREEVPVQVGHGSSGNGAKGASTTNGSYAWQDDQELPHELESNAISYQSEPEYLSEAEMDEDPPAGPSGFLVETFQPHFTLEPSIAVVEPHFVWNEKPALPENGMVAAVEPKPGLAGAVSLEAGLRMQDFRGNTRAPSVEVREMGRGAVNVNADFPEVVISGLEGTSRQMEISLKSYAPPDPPALWEEPAKEFTGFEAELGDLARLAFVTLGWDEIARNEGLEVQTLEGGPAVAAGTKRAVPEKLPAPPIEIRENRPADVTQPAPVQEIEKVQEIENAASPLDTVGEAEETIESAEPEQPAAESVPAPVTRPLPMTLHGHAPGRGKPVQVFPSAIARTAGIQIPRSNGLPLRPTMVFGPGQAPPVSAPAPVKEKSPVVPEPAKREAAAPPVLKKEAGAAPPRPDIKTLIKPSVQVRAAQPEKKDAEKTAAIPAAAVPAEKSKPAVSVPRKAEDRKVEDRRVEDRRAEDRRAEDRKVEDLKVAERKVDERKPEVKPEPVRKEAAAPPPAEPKVKKEPVMPVPIPVPLAPAYSDMDLGLPSLGMERSRQGFWAKLPVSAKSSVGAAVLVAIVGSYLYSTRHDAADAAPKGPVVVAAGNILSSGGAGWDTDWAPDPPNSKRQRRISLMHASQSLSDYRMELEGQIETKAMGWVFRASNPKNFYVEKIEIVKPGLEPKIQLVRFAVVDGVEQPHQEVPLTIPVRPDTMYKIRFEAIGDRFTTWLLDQKVDEWTDSRISSGGVGLYSESGESLSLKGGLNVVPLVVKR